MTNVKIKKIINVYVKKIMTNVKIKKIIIVYVKKIP